MRRLPVRLQLPSLTRRKLNEKTKLICSAEDSKSEAERIYTNSRRKRWFGVVVDMLRALAGPGERCMFCSGSESSEVEHYRPKSVFPEQAMVWENLLWSCGVCNRWKQDRFPPDTESGGTIVNPLEENVWEFFTLDLFGGLIPRWRIDLDEFEPRAVSTRDILKLDRQVLQESRRMRRAELFQSVTDALALFDRNEIDAAELAIRRDRWLAAPFQPDVADFYLNGPGRTEAPLERFLRMIDNV